MVSAALILFFLPVLAGLIIVAAAFFESKYYGRKKRRDSTAGRVLRSLNYHADAWVYLQSDGVRRRRSSKKRDVEAELGDVTNGFETGTVTPPAYLDDEETYDYSEDEEEEVSFDMGNMELPEWSPAPSSPVSSTWNGSAADEDEAEDRVPERGIILKKMTDDDDDDNEGQESAAQRRQRHARMWSHTFDDGSREVRIHRVSQAA